MRMRGRLAARSDARGARRHACVHLPRDRRDEARMVVTVTLSGRAVTPRKDRKGVECGLSPASVQEMSPESRLERPRFVYTAALIPDRFAISFTVERSGFSTEHEPGRSTAGGRRPDPPEHSIF